MNYQPWKLWKFFGIIWAPKLTIDDDGCRTWDGQTSKKNVHDLGLEHCFKMVTISNVQKMTNLLQKHDKLLCWKQRRVHWRFCKNYDIQVQSKIVVLFIGQNFLKVLIKELILIDSFSDLIIKLKFLECWKFEDFPILPKADLTINQSFYFCRACIFYFSGERV